MPVSKTSSSFMVTHTVKEASKRMSVLGRSSATGKAPVDNVSAAGHIKASQKNSHIAALSGSAEAIQSVLSVLNTANSAVQSQQELLAEAAALANTVATDLTLSAGEITALTGRFSQVIGGINSIAANLTDAGGSKILDGTWSKAVKVGIDAGDTITVAIDNLLTAPTAGLAIAYGNAGANGSNADEIDLTSAVRAAAAVAALKAAGAKLAGALAKNNTYQIQLVSRLDANTTQISSLIEDVNGILGADLIANASEMNGKRTAIEAAANVAAFEADTKAAIARAASRIAG